MRVVGSVLLLFALWLLWSGLMKPLLVVLGLGSSALCVWLGHRMVVGDEEHGPALQLWRFFAYLPWLLKEIAVANLKVIRVVLSPKPILDPVLFTLRSSPRSRLGRVVHGNSITLTPGTLTLDTDEDLLVVHALSRADAESLRSGELDRRVRALEASA